MSNHSNIIFNALPGIFPFTTRDYSNFLPFL